MRSATTKSQGVNVNGVAAGKFHDVRTWCYYIKGAPAAAAAAGVILMIISGLLCRYLTSSTLDDEPQFVRRLLRRSICNMQSRWSLMWNNRKAGLCFS